MLMEKIAIARGYQRSEPAPNPRPPLMAVQTADPPQTRDTGGEFQRVHDRLTALERLAALRERGALSEIEFASEKACILGGAADAAVRDSSSIEASAEAVRGPSLGSQLMRWHVLPLGLMIGLAGSYAAQPRETLRSLDELFRLLGI